MSIALYISTMAFSVTLACVTIHLTNRHSDKTRREIIRSTNDFVEDARGRGVQCIEHDLQKLSEVTLRTIAESGISTMNIITESGMQTRKAIQEHDERV